MLGLNPQTVAMGNGSTELITWLDHLLVRGSLAIPVPTFGRWTDKPMETGKRVDMFPLPEEQGFALDPAAYVDFIRARGSRTAVICNPNNPDGGYLPRRAVLGMNLNSFAEYVVFMLKDHQAAYRDSLRRLNIGRQEMSAQLAPRA